MESEVLKEVVVNNGTLQEFIKNGHSDYAIWIAGFQILLIFIIIPIVKYILKQYNEKEKLLTDIRVMKRDEELKDLNAKIKENKQEIDNKLEMMETKRAHSIDELSFTISEMKHQLDQIYEKIIKP